jgi:translation elongation factor EF-Tu-like GTPase
MLLLKRSAWEVIVAVLGLKEDVCIKTMLLLKRSAWEVIVAVRNKVNQGEKGLSADEVAADVLKLISDMGSTERQQPIHREADFMAVAKLFFLSFLCVQLHMTASLASSAARQYAMLNS